MSLREARKLLIDKLNTRITELVKSRPEGSSKWIHYDKEPELITMANHLEKLKYKHTREEIPLWTLEGNNNTPQTAISNSTIWIARQAYKLIKSEPENPDVKEIVDKAITFSLYNTFSPKSEPIDTAFNNPDAVATGFHNDTFFVKAIWQKGKPDKRLILLYARNDKEKLDYENRESIIKRCFPLTVT